MNIPVATVLLSYSMDPLQILQSEGATYTNLMKSVAESGDVMLFTNRRGSNLISLEHSVAFGGKTSLQLKFIDPKGEFERRFMSTSIIDSVAGYRTPTTSVDDYIRGEDDATQQKLLEDVIPTESYGDLITSFKKKIGTRKLFIAYGVGTNLTEWAGPLVMVPHSINVKVEGVQKFSVGLVPVGLPLHADARLGAYREIADLDLEGLAMEVEGRSNEIIFNHNDPEFEKDYGKTPLYTPQGRSAYISHGLGGRSVAANELAVIDALEQADYQTLGALLAEGVDIHTMVVDTIRNYIQKATSNPNVIVLLPNLNVICREVLTEVSFETRKSELLRPTYNKSAILADLRLRAALEGDQATGEVEQLLNSKALARYVEWKTTDTVMGKNLNYIESALSVLGLNLVSYPKADTIAPLGAFPIFSAAIVNMFREKEKAKNAKERQKKFINSRHFYASKLGHSTKGVPKHTEVLGDIITAIKRVSKGSYPLKTGIFYETDTRLLRYWAKQKDHPLFGGSASFESDQGAIIFGDQALISQFLYGRVDLQKTEESISAAKDKAATAQEHLSNRQVEAHHDQLVFFHRPSYSEEEKKLFINTISVIPLHPIDNALLSNQKYNEAVTDIMNPVVVVAGQTALGGASYIPEEFALLPEVGLGQEQRDYIKKKGIPVFRYNTSNPNVLGMKFNFGEIYLALLQAGFQKDVNKKATAVMEGVLPTVYSKIPIKTFGAAMGFLRMKKFSEGTPEGEEAKKELEQVLALGAAQMGELKSDTPEEAAAAIAAIYFANLQNDKAMLKIDQRLPGDALSLTAELVENLYRDALRLDIDTLPTFHISKMGDLIRPAILFAQDAPIIQGKPRKQALLRRFFSGLYKIIGMKHVINTRDVYSQFSLAKTSTSYTPKDTAFTVTETAGEGGASVAVEIAAPDIPPNEDAQEYKDYEGEFNAGTSEVVTLSPGDPAITEKTNKFLRQAALQRLRERQRGQ